MIITIGFSKPSNKFFPIFSWAVRAVLKTPYSHVYMKFHSDSLSRDIIYEAVGKGVRFVGLKQWSKKAIPVKEFQIDINQEQYLRLMQYCIDMSGISYGTVQNLGTFIAMVFNLKKNPFENGNSQIVCSELIADILEQLGYKFEEDKDIITPKDIYQALENGKN